MEFPYVGYPVDGISSHIKSCGWNFQPQSRSGNPVDTSDIQWIEFPATNQEWISSGYVGYPVDRISSQWMEFHQLDFLWLEIPSTSKVQVEFLKVWI